MSKLNRILKRTLRDLKGQEETWYQVLWESTCSCWDLFLDKVKYWEIKQFFKNLPFFIKAAWNWRSWDSSYSVTLFADALEETAKGLKKYGNLVRSEKNYRQCMRAAGQLRKAYNMSCVDDKSYMYWAHRNPIKWVDHGKSGKFKRMEHDYAVSKEYSDKMWKLINKRMTEAEKVRKEEAWAYIHKYIEFWWD